MTVAARIGWLWFLLERAPANKVIHDSDQHVQPFFGVPLSFRQARLFLSETVLSFREGYYSLVDSTLGVKLLPGDLPDQGLQFARLRLQFAHLG